MKKKGFFIDMLVIIALAFIVVSMLCGCDERNVGQTTAQAQRENLESANASIPIPQATYFQERRTIAKWAKRWDKPNVPCYVYLVSFGKIIGYYVTDGKPSSTRSYLLPETQHQKIPCSLGPHCQMVQSADLDGTYGENNPGIRFFTAEGTAVEWGGEGATYIYSDAPLPLNVPKLNRR